MKKSISTEAYEYAQEELFALDLDYTAESYYRDAMNDFYHNRPTGYKSLSAIIEDARSTAKGAKDNNDNEEEDI